MAAQPVPTLRDWCNVCGAAPAKKCSGCRHTRFCSTACQTVGWKAHGHKHICKILADQEGASTPSTSLACGQRRAVPCCGAIVPAPCTNRRAVILI